MKSCKELKAAAFIEIETVEVLARNFERRDRELVQCAGLPAQSFTGVEKLEKRATSFFSTGLKSIKGHTGYLTFAILGFMPGK